MQQEHELVTCRHIQPGERQARDKAASSAVAVVADLDDQQAAGVEVGGGMLEDRARGIQAVVAAAQREFGFMQVFLRQRGDRCGIHIGRVADDQVVSACRRDR